MVTPESERSRYPPNVPREMVTRSPALMNTLESRCAWAQLWPLSSFRSNSPVSFCETDATLAMRSVASAAFALADSRSRCAVSPKSLLAAEGGAVAGAALVAGVWVLVVGEVAFAAGARESAATVEVSVAVGATAAAVGDVEPCVLAALFRGGLWAS